MADERSRRHVLRLLSAGAALTASGCLGGESDTTETAGSATRTRSRKTTREARDATMTVPSGTARDRTDTGDATEASRTTTEPLRHTPTEGAEGPGPRTPDRSVVRWEFDLGRPSESPPSVGDGVVYAGTAGASPGTPDEGETHERHLFALDADDGTERWRYRTTHNVASRPVVVDDTVLFVTGASGMILTSGWGVTALDSGGERRWRQGTAPATILAAGSSTAFVGEHDGQFGTDAFPITSVTAYEVTSGRERWHRVYGKFTVFEERGGTLYFGTSGEGRSESGVYAVDTQSGRTEWREDDASLRGTTEDGLYGYRLPHDESELVRWARDGTEQWATTAEVSTVFAVGDGTVFTVESDAVVAYDADDGSERWREEMPVDYGASAEFGGGTLYVADGSGTVGAFDPDGTGRWRRSVTSVRAAAMVPTASGLLVVDEGHREVVALSGSDGSERWSLSTGGEPTVPAVVDGTAYLTAGDGSVYALPVE